MNSKSLLFGLIGFFLGGLVVSMAAATIERANLINNNRAAMHGMMNDSHTHGMMSSDLASRRGDAFDAVFIARMIDHHEGAVEMARLADTNAAHKEIKQLSKQIIDSQTREIEQMREWQKQWGFSEYHSTR